MARAINIDPHCAANSSYCRSILEPVINFAAVNPMKSVGDLEEWPHVRSKIVSAMGTEFIQKPRFAENFGISLVCGVLQS